MPDPGIEMTLCGNKIVRDIREFYRILFKCKFGSQFNCQDAEQFELMKSLFVDLKMQITQEESRDVFLLGFIRQVHMSTRKRLYKIYHSQSCFSPFRLAYYHNEITLKQFMTNTLASQMFYFVFSNFMHHYVDHVSK